jgi:uncharacterized protein
MNKVIILFSIAAVCTACDTGSKWKPNQEVITQGEVYKDLSLYAQKVMQHRDSTSTMFLSGANGVMPKTDISTTAKLKFFAPDEQYRVQAIFEPIENAEVIQMQTSTDEPRDYKRYGTLSFTLDNAPLQLTLYQNVEQPEYLFCPFKDLTNNGETYGAGRYLDFTLSDLSNPIIDFNYCYNPYCAYNPQYSCPIPPYENHLKVNILAGEKKWH